MNTKVSFIIAAYNAEKYIKESIDSCLTQDYNNIEICITDDGSTDKTWEIISEYSKNFSNVHIYRFKKNLGKVQAYNNSFEMSSGHYVAIMSADDICPKDRISKSIKILKEEHVDFVCGALAIFTENKLNTGSLTPAVSQHLVPEKLFRKNIVYGGTVLATKTCLSSCFPIPHNLVSEDWWIPLRTSLKFKLFYTSSVLLRYRIHLTNASIHLTKTIDFASWKKQYSRQENVFRNILQIRDLPDNLKKISTYRLVEQSLPKLNFFERISLISKNLYAMEINNLSVTFIAKLISPKMLWATLNLIKHLNLESKIRNILNK